MSELSFRLKFRQTLLKLLVTNTQELPIPTVLLTLSILILLSGAKTLFL